MTNIASQRRCFVLGGDITPFIGATSSANGSKGLVPAPLIADKDKFLKGDGTWGSAEVPVGTPGKITVLNVTFNITQYSGTSSGTSWTLYVIYLPATVLDLRHVVRIEIDSTNNLTYSTDAVFKHLTARNISINLYGSSSYKWVILNGYAMTYVSSSSYIGYFPSIVYGDINFSNYGGPNLTNTLYISSSTNPGKVTAKFYIME